MSLNLKLDSARYEIEVIHWYCSEGKVSIFEYLDTQYIDEQQLQILQTLRKGVIVDYVMT